MEVIFPGIGVWRGELNVDAEFTLQLWKRRYEHDRRTEWTGNPDDGPMQHFERGYGPLRCRNFELPDGLGKETEEDLFSWYLQEDLQKRLFEYMSVYPNSFKDIHWQEAHRLLYYYPGAKMGAHSDNTSGTMFNSYGLEFTDPVAPTRVLCSLQFLNDRTDEDEAGEFDYIGGELNFPYLDVTFVPRIGDTIIYPANFLFSHEVTPVLDGHRIVNLTCWCRGDFSKLNFFTQDGGEDQRKWESVPGGNCPMEFADGKAYWKFGKYDRP